MRKTAIHRAVTGTRAPRWVMNFRERVYSHYSLHGRDLPWRNGAGPYGVFVSEVMLQQTQVDRVIPKYVSFLARFPGFRGLAEAPLGDVLREWKGLGYNRRALALHRAAGIIVGQWEGVLPADPALLERLPGIGKATAASICAYAFKLPVVFIETNIRAVFIHHFFRDREGVSDSDILPLAEKALDRDDPARWYNALMDYGVMLKRLHGNPARKSATHRKQPAFTGSVRQARGLVLKRILEGGSMRQSDIEAACGEDRARTVRAIAELVAEGFIVREKRGRYRVADSCSAAKEDRHHDGKAR